MYALVYTWDGSRPVEFDWDEANTAHIARHGVRPEEALANPRRLVLRIRSQAGEERWAALGATEAGRILFVVFTRRRGRARVITARDATPEEKRRYRKRG
ncbi:BrnT family toxin, partial [Thermus sp.]|uniref:BrnT family toxin n=1 Tax=Thermus sp. TaxID=275 RepID=UPI0028CBEF84